MTSRDETAGVVEQLRDKSTRLKDDSQGKLCSAEMLERAADLIERQAREIAELKRALDALSPQHKKRVQAIAALGECEAIVPKKWYADAHKCPFPAITDVHGKKLCGVHARSLQ